MGKPASQENFAPSRKRSRYHRAVRIWLIVGLVMVVGQIVIGGITRLTESGLSITEWKPLSGAMPPLDDADWTVEFEKYQASPQYAKIFADISLADFKFIYFWEWFHRQWARTMGLVFVVGFLVFWRKKYLDPPLMRRLGIVVLLAAIAASFGWIMVASGLKDRPWVDAYKLTMHLALGITLFSYLLWITLKVIKPIGPSYPPVEVNKLRWPLNGLVILQLLLGGVMSGARAALPYPTWPDMNGKMVPDVLKNGSQWTVENLVNYESSMFQPALVQFLHRGTAYALTVMVLYFIYRCWKSVENRDISVANTLLVSLLVTQVTLGIFTVVNSVGQVPVGLGVAHQFTAIALVATVVYINYLFKPGRLLGAVENTVEN